MCGFAGFVAFGATRLDPVARAAILARMGNAIAHRGPNDEQIYDDGKQIAACVGDRLLPAAQVDD